MLRHRPPVSERRTNPVLMSFAWHSFRLCVHHEREGMCGWPGCCFVNPFVLYRTAVQIFRLWFCLKTRPTLVCFVLMSNQSTSQNGGHLTRAYIFIHNTRCYQSVLEPVFLCHLANQLVQPVVPPGLLFCLNTKAIQMPFVLGCSISHNVEGCARISALLKCFAHLADC